MGWGTNGVPAFDFALLLVDSGIEPMIRARNLELSLILGRWHTYLEHAVVAAPLPPACLLSRMSA